MKKEEVEVSGFGRRKRVGRNRRKKERKKSGGRKPSVQTYKNVAKNRHGSLEGKPKFPPEGVFNPLLPFDRWEGKENPTRSANFVIPPFLFFLFFFSLSL